MIDDLLKTYQLVKSGQVPMWLVLIVGGSFLLNLFLPFFKFRHEINKNKRDEKRKNFLEAKNAIGDLKERRNEFVSYINNLVVKIKSNKIRNSDLAKYQIVDDFFEDLMTICEGVEQGFTTKTGNISNMINCVLKHKYDKKDNLIIDAYNAVKIAHSKAGKSFNEPLRIDRYDALFRVYRGGFPFYKRCVGFFFKKVFDIKEF